MRSRMAPHFFVSIFPYKELHFNPSRAYHLVAHFIGGSSRLVQSRQTKQMITLNRLRVIIIRNDEISGRSAYAGGFRQINLSLGILSYFFHKKSIVLGWFFII